MNTQHGMPKAANRHVGDIGNINVAASGSAEGMLKDNWIQLYGEFSIIGRSVCFFAL